MPQTPSPAGYKLVEAGTLMEFEVLSTETKPTASDDGAIVDLPFSVEAITESGDTLVTVHG